MTGIIYSNTPCSPESIKTVLPEPWLTINTLPGSSNDSFFHLTDEQHPDKRLAGNDHFSIVLEGELTDLSSLRAMMPNSKRSTSPAETICFLLSSGCRLESIAQAIDGMFFMAIQDQRNQSIHFISDRFGTRPHYYTHHNNQFAIAPSIKSLLLFPWVSTTLNKLSVAEYFNIQCVMENRTLLKDIFVFPSASIMTLRGPYEHSLTCHHYWNADNLPPIQNLSFKKAVDKTASLLEDAVHKRTQNDQRYGVYLSGGLDSRCILAAIPKKPEPLHTITFGIPRCRDHIYAQRISEHYKTIHHAVHFNDGLWLREIAEKHTWLSECFHCLLHSHNLWKASELRDVIDVNISGHVGDVVLGGSFQPSQASPEKSFFDFVWNRYIQAFGIAFPNPGEFDTAWNFGADVSLENVKQTFRTCFTPYEKMPSHIANDFFTLEYRERKQIQYYMIHNRPYFKARAPFIDKPLIDHLYSLPPAYRENRQLQIAVLNQLDEKAGRVPWDKDNSLPTTNKWRKLAWAPLYYSDRLSNRIFKRSIPILFPPYAKYQDYHQWATSDLAGWLREELTSSSSRIQNFFRDDYTRNLLNHPYQAKMNPYAWVFKIGTMVSLEIFMRQLQTVKERVINHE